MFPRPDRPDRPELTGDAARAIGKGMSDLGMAMGRLATSIDLHRRVLERLLPSPAPTDTPPTLADMERKP